MTRKRFLHPERPAEVLHVTMKTTGKVDVHDAWTLNDERRERLIEQFHRFLKLFGGLTTVGFQCMNNHFHVLIKLDHTYKRSRSAMAEAYFECYGRRIHPNSSECYQLLKDQSNISKFIGRFARDFSYHYNLEIEVDRTGHLWQKRFHSTQIEDTAGLLRCWTYIIMNPVKAGMTLSATADQFSSLTYKDQDWCHEIMRSFYELWQDYEDGHQHKTFEEFKQMIIEMLEEAVQAYLALGEAKREQWKAEQAYWKRALAVGSKESLAKCRSLPGVVHETSEGSGLCWC